MARPTGVTILAVLSFLGAGLSLLGACFMFVVGAAGMAAMAGGRAMGGPFAALGAFAGVALLLFGVLYIVNGVGLLKLRPWGRLLTIILSHQPALRPARAVTRCHAHEYRARGLAAHYHRDRRLDFDVPVQASCEAGFWTEQRNEC